MFFKLWFISLVRLGDVQSFFSWKTKLFYHLNYLTTSWITCFIALYPFPVTFLVRIFIVIIFYTIAGSHSSSWTYFSQTVDTKQMNASMILFDFLLFLDTVKCNTFLWKLKDINECRRRSHLTGCPRALSTKSSYTSRFWKCEKCINSYYVFSVCTNARKCLMN